MGTYETTIGLDVSKDYLDFAVHQAQVTRYLGRVPNETGALQAYLEELVKQYDLPTTLFCLETTGLYTQGFLMVSQALGLAVWHENALEISQSLGLKRGKNDILDAQAIARYAYRNQDKVRLYSPPSEILADIKHLLALRERLLESLKRLEVPANELKLFAGTRTLELLDKCSQTTRDALKSDLKTLEKELFKLLDTDEDLKKKYELVTSVVGIGKWTAFPILVTTEAFQKIDDPKKYACYCGVVPFAKSSGKKKGRNKVSFLANKAMKTHLHMGALSAIRHDPQIKAYYDRKVKEGKPKMSVINAVRNKLIGRIFAVIRKEMPYQVIFDKNAA